MYLLPFQQEKGHCASTQIGSTYEHTPTECLLPEVTYTVNKQAGPSWPDPGPDH